jgi:hypothetical protein
MFSQDAIRVATGKYILHSPIKYCHLKLFIEILFKKSFVLCLIYNTSLTIYDSNWYIKCLNNIEIDLKNALFSDVKDTIFGR